MHTAYNYLTGLEMIKNYEAVTTDQWQWRRVVNDNMKTATDIYGLCRYSDKKYYE